MAVKMGVGPRFGAFWRGQSGCDTVYIGYRFCEKKKRDTLFTFGHGLSYTSFELGGFSLETTPSNSDAGRESVIKLGLDVKNTSNLQRKRDMRASEADFYGVLVSQNSVDVMTGGFIVDRSPWKGLRDERTE
ncbi:hypothetical protein MAPG_01201 [Magnaporthiopsis poae ATCC 64411]|uniref:beta-glucosidase n=1 Tax=Magnaporthiopsis poae (strain ATCC 64411 / 73-15) TaxID=644358 RepID=A0A0C4DN28_MAGP6|nr:hypothetical protein MAPG_01201 [Magnaporthiopsis poae ATCC 64411]